MTFTRTLVRCVWTQELLAESIALVIYLTVNSMIVWSVEGFAVCGEQLFSTGTGSALLVIDITES